MEQEDKLYGVRVYVGTGNALTLDLRGAGSVYLEPKKFYYFENTPINFINRLVELGKIGITYQISKDRKGCFKTINMINYDVVAARSLLSKIKGLYETKEEVKDLEPEAIEEAEIQEPETIEETPIEEVAEEVEEETVEDIVEEAVEEAVEETVDEVVDEVVDEEVEEATEEVAIPSIKEINDMSKPKLLELAVSLGIDSVSEINTKKEIRSAILEKIN